MRYLVISDIHANLAAFEAVLAHAAGEFDFIWCLGDMVGYGPDPNECIARLRDFPHLCLAGNHDWAALGRLDIQSFNTDARVAVLWTQQELTPASRAYLESLPTNLVQDSFTLAHASPRQPVWEYVLDPLIAQRNFAYFDTPYCLIGHTHIPVIFRRIVTPGGEGCQTLLPPFKERMPLGEAQALVNPGSVGQPRDGDPRASYAILDTETMTWDHRRIPYPVEITQEKMRARGMPVRLIERLAYGR